MAALDSFSSNRWEEKKGAVLRQGPPCSILLTDQMPRMKVRNAEGKNSEKKRGDASSCRTHADSSCAPDSWDTIERMTDEEVAITVRIHYFAGFFLLAVPARFSSPLLRKTEPFIYCLLQEYMRTKKKGTGGVMKMSWSDFRVRAFDTPIMIGMYACVSS
jgi:hypothetical protein